MYMFFLVIKWVINFNVIELDDEISNIVTVIYKSVFNGEGEKWIY